MKEWQKTRLTADFHSKRQKSASFLLLLSRREFAIVQDLATILGEMRLCVRACNLLPDTTDFILEKLSLQANVHDVMTICL